MMWRLLHVILLQAVLAVPLFHIDLNVPPRLRYHEVHRYFLQESKAMLKMIRKTLDANFSPVEQAEWLAVLKADAGDEILSELRGIVDVLNGTDDDYKVLILSNALYELESPTLCGGLLTVDHNGTVIHGRNMDYRLKFRMPGGAVEDWPNVTYEAVYLVNGVPMFTSVQWALWTGIHTGMRYGGWTFEQNTRPLNFVAKNLEAAKMGGKSFGWFVRKLMVTTPDFESALRTMNATSFMAPQFFIMAGSKPYEGAVISMDRLVANSDPNTPAVRGFGPDTWYLLQTNYDSNKLSLDPRRPATVALLDNHSAFSTSIDFVWSMILGPTLHNPLTVFSWVAVPSTNYSKVVLPGEHQPASPTETEEVLLLQKFMARSLAKSRPLYSNGKRLLRVVDNEGIHLAPADA
mmetsp:Transcript_30674/g.70850  ORF Transcript_30674/g.70850 Transcript_30674/m.70850 type:complete len:405 (+) Transcript_30674:64-1278(+)